VGNKTRPQTSREAAARLGFEHRDDFGTMALRTLRSRASIDQRQGRVVACALDRRRCLGPSVYGTAKPSRDNRCRFP
jgi:hypothetical protein